MGIFDCLKAATADTTSVYSPSEATQASDQAKNRGTPVNVHWDENTSPTKQFGIGYSHSPREVDAYIRPVIHCRLKGKAELTSATEGLDLLAPRDEESSPTRFKPREEKYPSVVLCVPTSCNESALTAWGVSNTQQLQTRLRNICMADTSFLNLLSTVAMSVVAPTVLQQSEGACVMMYRPSPSTSNLIPGGCNIRLSGTFMREDVEDFSFFPFLILELDQPGPEPLSLLTMHYEAQDEKLMNLLLTSLSRVEPIANLKSGPNENVTYSHEVGNPAPSSSLEPGVKTSLISTKEQDTLARSFAMISSVPCIATLLELRPVGNPSLDQVEGEDRSTAFQGCILMQNQLSISYWGELSTNHPQGSWLLLMELFKEEPNTIMELIKKIEREKRKQGGLLPSTSGKEEGSWKKAIQVPASGQHLAARLSDDAQNQSLEMYYRARSSNSGSILPVSVLSDTGPQPAFTDTSPPGLKSSLNTVHLGSKSRMAADERLGSPVTSGSFAIFGSSRLQRRSFSIPVTAQAQPLSPTLATGPQESAMEDGGNLGLTFLPSKQMLSLLAARDSHNSDSDPNNAPSSSPVHRRGTLSNEKPALKKQLQYDATTSVMKPLRGSAEDLNIASNSLVTLDPHSNLDLTVSEHREDPELLGNAHNKLDMTVSEHREDPELLGNAHSKNVSGLNSMEGKTTVIKPSTRQLSDDADSSGLGSFLGSWQEVSGSVSRSYRETSLPAHNSQDPGPSSNTSSTPPVVVRKPLMRGQLSFSSKRHVNSGASTTGLTLPPQVASRPGLAAAPLLGSADVIASTSQFSGLMSGLGSGGFHSGSTALGSQPSRAALLLGSVPTSMDLLTPISGLSTLPEVPSTASPVSTRVTKLSSQRTSNLNFNTGGAAQSPTWNAAPVLGSPSPRESRHLMTPSPSSPTIHRDKSSVVHSDSTIPQGGESEAVNEFVSVGPNPDLTSGREAPSGYKISAALPKNSAVTSLDQEAAGKTENNGLIQARAYDDNSAVLTLLSGPVKDLLNQASGCQHLGGQSPSGFAATVNQTGQLQVEGSLQGFAKIPPKGAGKWSLGDIDRTVDHGVNQDKLVGAVVEGGPSEGMHAPAGAWDVQGVMEGLEKEEEEEEVEEETVRWHEVQAVPLCDPVTGKEAILLIQNDITARSVMESRMAALTESQLTMLENMFPRHVLEFVVGAASPDATLGDLAYQHEDVTILFMDIVGFTSMSKEVAPHMVMEFLNDLFSKFDELCDQYNVYKVETAGDCYIVAGALMELDEEGFMTLDFHGDAGHGAKNVVDFGQAMLRHARTINTPHNGQPTCVRVGIHTGSVVSGLIGTKLPKFSLFGDTMNTSSRMESTSKPGCIQISQATYSMLGQDQQALFLPSGGVEVKGKGLMATYLYTPSELDLELRPKDVSTLGLVTGTLMSEAQADGAQVMDEELIQDLELSHDNYAGTLSRQMSPVIADGMNKLPVPQQTWVPENRLDLVPEASIAPLPGMPVLTSGTALDLSNRKALALSEASTQALESPPVSRAASTQALESPPVSRAAGSELEYNLCKAPSGSLSLDVSPQNIPAGAEEGADHASVRKIPIVSDQIRLEEDVAAVAQINNEVPGQVLALPASGRMGDDTVTPASSSVEKNVGGRRILSTRTMEIQQALASNRSGSLRHTLGTPAGAVGYKPQPGTGSSSGRPVGSSTTGGSTPGPISFVEAVASFASTQKLIAEASDQGTGNLSQEGVIGKSPKNKLAILRMGGTMRRAPRKVASSVALKPSLSVSSCKAADAEETSITFLPTPDASFIQEEESSGSHDIAFPAMSGRMKGNGRSIAMSTGPMDSKEKKVSAVRRFSSLAPPRLASAGSPKVARLDGLGSPVGNPLHDAADTSKPFGSWHFKHALADVSPRRRSLDLVRERFEKIARAEFKDAKNVVAGSSLENIIMGSQCGTDEAVRNVAASGTSGATEPGGQLLVPSAAAAAAAAGGNGKVASRRRPSSLLMLQKMIHLISDTPPSEFG